MKKVFKILSIIAISIVCIIALIFGGAVLFDLIEDWQRDYDRINNSETLSQYIEHHGWEYLGGTFDALQFYAKDIKFDLPKDRTILYCTENFLVLDDYTIYETAFTSDKVYSNGQQYKQIETDVEFKKAIPYHYTLFLVGTDNIYYTIDRSYNGDIATISIIKAYPSEITEKLLNDDLVIKIVDITSHEYTNTDKNKYLVLKNDGQIYSQEYERKFNFKQNEWQYTLLEEKVLLSTKDYGHITDFTYSTLEDYIGVVKVVSDKGLYWLKQTSEKEFIDSVPTYELVQSDIYNKYKKDIKYINADYIFTTDNNIIKTDMLCGEIDKEVK